MTGRPLLTRRQVLSPSCILRLPSPRHRHRPLLTAPVRRGLDNGDIGGEGAGGGRGVSALSSRPLRRFGGQPCGRECRQGSQRSVKCRSPCCTSSHEPSAPSPFRPTLSDMPSDPCRRCFRDGFASRSALGSCAESPVPIGCQERCHALRSPAGPLLSLLPSRATPPFTPPSLFISRHLSSPVEHVQPRCPPPTDSKPNTASHGTARGERVGRFVHPRASCPARATVRPSAITGKSAVQRSSMTSQNGRDPEMVNRGLARTRPLDRTPGATVVGHGTSSQIDHRRCAWSLPAHVWKSGIEKADTGAHWPMALARHLAGAVVVRWSSRKGGAGLGLESANGSQHSHVPQITSHQSHPSPTSVPVSPSDLWLCICGGRKIENPHDSIHSDYSSQPTCPHDDGIATLHRDRPRCSGARVLIPIFHRRLCRLATFPVLPSMTKMARQTSRPLIMTATPVP